MRCARMNSSNPPDDLLPGLRVLALLVTGMHEGNVDVSLSSNLNVDIGSYSASRDTSNARPSVEYAPQESLHCC